MRKHLQQIIDRSISLGLPQADVNHAKEFLDHGEEYLAFDQVVTQLYEFGIKVDTSFYELVGNAGKNLKLREEEYLFIKELISDQQILK